MRKSLVLLIFLLLVGVGLALISRSVLRSQLRNGISPSAPGRSPPLHSTGLTSVFRPSLTPIRADFIENRGQADSQVLFYLQASGQTLWFTPNGIVIDLLKWHARKSVSTLKPVSSNPSGFVDESEARLVIRQEFLGSNDSLTFEGSYPQPGKLNFFRGGDPENWRTGISRYGELGATDVWEGIDLRFYTNRGGLEQEYVVHPGADPAEIRVGFQGIKGLQVADNAALQITTAFGDLSESRPRAYQLIDGQRREVDSRFKLIDQTSYTFTLADYDPRYPLVIDPTLTYSTYLGGAGGDTGMDIALDGEGNTYIAGITTSTDFPVTEGAFGTVFGGGSHSDAFVAKLNPTGTELIYATYLGSESRDEALGIAVNNSGEAFVTGWTFFGDFPTTLGSFQPNRPGGQGWSGFVTRLNAAGSGLTYSTYLGGAAGTDQATAIAVDAAGNAYVTGETGSSDFPTESAIQSALSGPTDAFLTKINDTGSALVYSTFLGGSNEDAGKDVDLDENGSLHMLGHTHSHDLLTVNAAQATFGGGNEDVFVVKVNPTGDSFVYATYLGGQDNACCLDEIGASIAVGDDGAAYVTGSTSATDFPTTEGVIKPNCASDTFVTKLDAQGQFVYSTCLGGSLEDWAQSIDVDGEGNAYVAGYTASEDFPVADAVQPEPAGQGEGFLAELNPTGTDLVYATYLGSSDTDLVYAVVVDDLGDAYVTGETFAADFPTTPFAFDRSFAGSHDAFVSKIALCASGTLTVTAALPTSGGDIGPVTVLVHGSRLEPGAVVRLSRSGEQDIVADPVTVDEGCRTLQAIFDLTGKAWGNWDLVVTNPGGDSASLPGAFTIEEGERARIWIDIVGQDAIRVGRQQAYTVLYGNTGNIDASGASLRIIAPADMEAQLVPFEHGDIGLETPASFSTGDERIFSVVVPTIPPGSSGALRLKLLAPVASDYGLFADSLTLPLTIAPTWPQPFISGEILEETETTLKVYAQVVSPGATGALTMTLSIDDALTPKEPSLEISEIPAGAQLLASTTVEGSLKSWDLEVLSQSKDVIDAIHDTQELARDKVWEDRQIEMSRWIRDRGIIDQQQYEQLVERAGYARRLKAIKIPIRAAAGKVHAQYFVDYLFGGAEAAFRAAWPISVYEIYLLSSADSRWGLEDGRALSWAEFLAWLENRVYGDESDFTERTISGVLASDPNLKIGESGAGDAHYISGEEPLRYTIFFENVETATAPAQEVIISDTLDSVTMDLSTLSLGPMIFGDRQVIPPPGLKEYATELDLRPEHDLLLGIEATLDASNDLLVWRFTSLDPVTRELTEDPLAGFLPPNNIPPEGEGSVFFTVMPKSDLSTGTEIVNQASIVFDVNAPIETPLWLNTIDKTAPSSQVLSLGESQHSIRFPVQWSGSDEGSEVRDYVVFVSVDGAAFLPWLTNASTTTATFTGSPGHTYGFYSTARDNVGRVEEAPLTADTSTRVDYLVFLPLLFR